MIVPARPAYRQWAASPWADVALAASLTLLAQAELRSAEQGGLVGTAQGIAMLAQTAPVALRRTYTVAAASLSASALIVESLLLTPTNTLGALLAGLILTYSVGRRLSGWSLYLVSGLILIAVILHSAVLPEAGPGDLAFAVLFTGAAWGIGRGGHRREEAAAAAARLAWLQESEREAQIASALAEERAQIAREMHDVVAHGMGVMVVQAAAAEHLMDCDPEQARQPLATVRETGQQSLAEMRRLLGLLRSGSGTADNDARSPQPSLSQVPALVAQLRAAGMPVTLTQESPAGDSPKLPPGLDLCAFRIVQESLTNSLKHGRGAPTTVSVATSESAVNLTITTARPDRPSAPVAGASAGHGLIGMRERVAVYGGTLTTQPQPGGGFLVHAHLPIPR